MIRKSGVPAVPLRAIVAPLPSIVSVSVMTGRPFVASDVPGLAEIVSGAGLLFPLQDENELARLISQLINDKAYCDSVASLGAERAKSYGIDIMIDRHIALYQNL